MSVYDVAVLGGGPGGYVAALRAAQRGAATCLVEMGNLGGVCLNVGCIPTKAMLHASDVYHSLGSVDVFGLSAGTAEVDGPAFMKRVTGVVDGLRKGVGALLKKRGVDVIRGRGRLTGRDRLAVETDDGTEEVQARAIILATGSSPVRPGFAPWESDRLWTTDEATTAEALPESVLIVGGGVIGCEFATIYAELGIPTTVVEMLDRLLPTLDEDASKAVRKSLKRRRVTILTGAKITTMEATDEQVTAQLEGGRSLEVDRALVAVGRAANLDDLGLEDVGIERHGGIIRVDDACRTSVDGVYAVGDCAAELQYAHLASRMGTVAADNATGHPSRDAFTVVPQVVYTHPEIATVGLTEAEARHSGRDVRVARFPFQASGMARAYDATEGEVELIAETEHGEILGAAVIAARAADIIQEITLAMKNELTVEEVAGTIHPHPTFGEAVHEAAELWLGFPVHTAG
ncbi:MAG: dihydrolipoyl dehydrogenase [Phycisphaerae bacterium]